MAATDCGVTVACAVAVARSDCFRARINTGRPFRDDNPCILSPVRRGPGPGPRAPVGGACGRDSRRLRSHAGVALVNG